MNKKLFVATCLIIIVVGIAVVFGNSENFLGKLVFFQSAPTKEKVINNNFTTYHEAAKLLMEKAISAKKITTAKAKEIAQQILDTVPEDQKITRGQFAELAVKIFGIQKYGNGIGFSDVNQKHPGYQSIYLFSTNGGMDAEFKPDNMVTGAFAEKAATGLTVR